MFSGAVKLRLEQEGEAQLCSKRCGLYSEVQPGETHIQFAPMSHSVPPQVTPKRRGKTVPFEMFKIYEPLPEVVVFEAPFVMAAPSNLHVSSLLVISVINSPQVRSRFEGRRFVSQGPWLVLESGV